MIAISLQGGLGNQMFQYATCYALASIRKTTAMLCTDILDVAEHGITKREFELGVFGLHSSPVNPYKSNSLFNCVRKQLNVVDVYYEKGLSFHNEVLSLRKNSLLEGYFQCEKYFDFCRESILAQFTFPELSGSGKKVLKTVQSAQNSASVHVRRGDYLSNKSAAGVHGVLPIDYYLRAFKQMGCEDMTFFVFSDDVMWCKQAFHGQQSLNIKFVENTEEMEVWEDMYLMSRCDNQIIANSSYSWWAAWLNQNNNKTVIAPKNWFVDIYMNELNDIIPETWISL